MSKFEQSTGSLNEALGKKPDDSKSTEAKTADVLANLERNFQDLSKVEKNEAQESPEKNENPTDQPENSEKDANKVETVSNATSPQFDKKDRPQDLTTGYVMSNILAELGLQADVTSNLVNDIMNSNLTTRDRKALTQRSPEGAAAVKIASKIEGVLGQVNGNSDLILNRAQKIVAGEAAGGDRPILENYAQQVAEQLNRGLPAKEAMAYVLVNQMATSFVEGLGESTVKLS